MLFIQDTVIQSTILTQDHQLYVFGAGFCVLLFSLVSGILIIMRQVSIIERKFGTVTPLWRHAISALSGELMHPHEFAQEMDTLLKEANLEPEVLMLPERRERLKVLLLERSKSTNINMRVNENDAALAYLLIMKFALSEEQSPLALAGITLVGTQAPSNQTEKRKQD